MSLTTISFINHFPSSQPTLLSNHTNDILISNHMPQADPLRDMPRRSPPHQRVLERLLERSVYGVACVLDCGGVLDDERVGERWDFAAAVWG